MLTGDESDSPRLCRSDNCIQVLSKALEGKTVDVVIANAGILRTESSGLDDIEKHFPEMVEQFNVNTLGPIRTVRGLDKCLKEGSKVAIITSRVGSIADNGGGGLFGYRMSKVTTIASLWVVVPDAVGNHCYYSRPTAIHVTQTAVNMAGVNLAHALKERGIAVGLIHPGSGLLHVQEMHRRPSTMHLRYVPRACRLQAWSRQR